MSESFQKNAAAAGRGLKKLACKIAKLKPKNKAGVAVKYSAATAVGLLRIAEALVRKGVLDNSFLRKLETGLSKIKTDDMFKSFVKQNSNLVAHIVYLGMTAGIILGGKALVQNYTGNDKKDVVKKEVVKKEVNVQGGSLNPLSEDFYTQCAARENITCIPIIYTETYRAKPKVQAKENVWTHGFGMTWSPDSKGHMKIRDYEKNQYEKVKNAKGEIKLKLTAHAHRPVEKRTKDADIDESQQFLKDHIYPKIKANTTRALTENEFYAVCVAGYQMSGHTAQICKQLSSAKTPQEIADAFITPTMYNYGGTPKRRWVCAMLATGFIDLQDILDADIDAFYAPDINTFMRKGHFVCNNKTVEYILGLKANKSTRSVVNQLADGKSALNQIHGAPRTIIAPDISNQEIGRSMANMIAANKKFAVKDYDAAAELFTAAISEDKDNMEAYSSLALTYKRLGDAYKTSAPEKAVSYYEKSIAAVIDCNARMNKNRQLLYDPVVKASSYYNAGGSREGIGDIAVGKKDFDVAVQNYNLAQKNFDNALYNYNLTEDGDESVINTYKSAITRMQTAVNALKLQKANLEKNQKAVKNKAKFDNGKSKIQQKQQQKIQPQQRTR